jgi:hypothetical protein
MEFHLLIDDLREMRMDHVARTPEDGRKALLSFPVTHLWMDHDLGDTGTGYQVITWALERGCCPPNVTFVTSNPVGRANMVAALESYGYGRHGHWYTKEQK